MCLHVSLNPPREVAERVRREVPDLEGAARESLLPDLFRRDVLSHYELSQALGIDRFETDAFIKRRGIFEGALTHEEVDEDVRTLKRLLEKPNQ